MLEKFKLLAQRSKPQSCGLGADPFCKEFVNASLANSGSPLQKREKLYLLVVGYYRSGEYRRSRQLAEQCLEIAPDWMQALTLKKTLDDQITKDGLIGIGITATVVGLVAGGIAASLG
ncbi:hypothetical protein HYC85_009657 [Camellia sinensis]|uniref:Mitochondrial fission 1 protein n=1 Tax=Camellia sinensis TaxID=4442 RepID=A0A7J7HFL1_CAMSI|nr:hypothetical protein HYC85_009657 [Camellia sinensis]